MTQTVNRDATASVPKVAFEKYTLPNGLQVILHVDRKLPVVHVNQWFHVGSKNEKIGRTGFAHLFEHMMFQGSKNATGEYFSYVEKAGANLFTGGVNGTTDPDRTNYFATVPSANLEYLLWLESDRLATLADALTKEKLDNQRDVVKNERRQGLENTPYGRSFTLITENLHPAKHPYSWDVIGSHEDLTAATLDDVKEFFKTYYTPNNMSLVIAGDFDSAEAKRLVEKYFGPIPAGPALDRPARWIPTLDGEKIVEAKDRVPQERTFLAWPTPPFFEAGDAELDIAAAILADGLSSRLKKTLVYDKQLCSDVSAFNQSAEISSGFVVDATARPGASLAQIEGIITDEIARFAQSGPTPEELNRAKNKIEYGFVTGLERIGGFGGKSDRLNRYNTYLGDPGKFEEDLARYRNASSNAVRDAAAKWLNTRNRLIVRFHPETSGRETQAAQLDRAKLPEIGVDKAFRAPEVKTAKLENGVEIFVVERPELPKVAVALAARAGSVADTPGKEGTAHLTVTTIDMGTKTKNAIEIGDAFGDLGTSLQGTAGRESAVVSFEVLKKNLAPAMNVFADVIQNPIFPAVEVEREKKIHLDNLSQEANDPNALAGRISNMLVFGADHPYGRPRTGLPATVKATTRDDLARFHETYWKPGGAALIFAGDITLAEATEAARQSFGKWAGGAPPKVTIPAPQPVGAGKVFLIDKQDAAQTVVAQLLAAPPRKTDDYYSLNLADAVWGGGFQTRLNLNLREEKGYSYGVFSQPSLYSQAGIWRSSGGVQTNKTKESLVEFVNELGGLSGKKPITEKELADARANRVRGYAQNFEALGQIVGQIANLWALGLPLTELQREPDELQKATLISVNAAAQKYAVPGKATLLLIGDLSKIRPGVTELNLGEIVVVDAEGKPVTQK
ncbi:MAG TPA: pitrilysin family protein [Pyrinomonadaceae bacterium]|nr:pitrilysin family protein [Pyrinomonadaceae bacterium]